MSRKSIPFLSLISHMGTTLHLFVFSLKVPFIGHHFFSTPEHWSVVSYRKYLRYDKKGINDSPCS